MFMYGSRDALGNIKPTPMFQHNAQLASGVNCRLTTAVFQYIGTARRCLLTERLPCLAILGSPCSQRQRRWPCLSTLKLLAHHHPVTNRYHDCSHGSHQRVWLIHASSLMAAGGNFSNWVSAFQICKSQSEPQLASLPRQSMYFHAAIACGHLLFRQCWCWWAVLLTACIVNSVSTMMFIQKFLITWWPCSFRGKKEKKRKEGWEERKKEKKQKRKGRKKEGRGGKRKKERKRKKKGSRIFPNHYVMSSVIPNGNRSWEPNKKSRTAVKCDSNNELER